MITELIAQAAVAASTLAHPAAAPAVPAVHTGDANIASQASVVSHVTHNSATKTVHKVHVVREGDTLSGIAEKHRTPGGWMSIYAANHHKIKDPNLIYVGQKLVIPVEAMQVALPVRHEYTPRHTRVTSFHPTIRHHYHHHYYHSPFHRVATTYRARPTSSFEACVIARESGGNSQVMNSSGHYGLYQFSESTWIAYGGSAGTFGHASVSEQKRVFDNAIARGGQSNWSPYDGC